MNGAPDWQDGECCFRCRTQFTLVARKHHCRNCGNIFCAKCSSQQIPLPKLNIDKPVRVCDGCYEKVSSKNADPLASAIDRSSDSDHNKAKTNSKPSGSSKSTSGNKPAANASAPSEQELKEEEELQLALALSLSEAPAKVSFPDCRQFEDSTPVVVPTSSSISNHVEHKTTGNSVVLQTSTTPQSVVPTTEPSQFLSGPERQQPQQQQFNSIPQNFPQEHQVPLDQDQELFRFVTEVQSTSEVFTNRVNSSKLRNRPIANDSAIQALFLKLTNMHTKLLEYIKTHEEERSGYEALQDKLSQIADARAALDALREEHQEKIRQEAAEAERQRQSQLALKLEMMRQKKSQMMQYQREVALQRIQAQEMMLRQPQGYQAPTTTASTTVPQQVLPPPPTTPIQQPSEVQSLPPPVQQQVPTIQQAPIVQQSLFHAHAPQTGQPFIQHQQQQQPQHQINHSTQQPPVAIPKPDDEAPLISFDD